jgi:anaerobic magnesium-protoporphyrin IX monomethyl ester cyclase
MQQYVSIENLMPQKLSSHPRKMLLFVLPYFVGKVDALGVKTRSYLAFPYGPLTIASYISKNTKTDSKLIIEDLNLLSEDSLVQEKVINSIMENSPDFVGFSFMFDSSFSFLEELSNLVGENFPKLTQVVGGAGATTATQEILNQLPCVTAVCYSEGESAILRLLDMEDSRFQLSQNPWVTRGSLSKKVSPDYVSNLDDVIDLDYRHVDVARYSMKESFSPFAVYRYSENVKQFFLVTSRGCPFKCTFCAEPALHGANMRFSSVDAIIDHVRKLKELYGINVLTIYDDQLLIDVPRAKELFGRLAEFKLRIEMPNGVTAVFIDDELALLMKRAGVDTIALAIESGSDYVLRNIINKPLRIPKLRKVMDSLRKAEIFVQAFFVIGMPGETDEHRGETLQLIRDMDFDWSSFSVAGPVRGSELYEEAKRKGWLPKEYSVGKFVSNSAVLNIPGYDNEAIMRAATEFNLISNFINSRALRLKDYTTARRLFKEVSERANKHAFAHFFLWKVEEKLGMIDESRTNFEIAEEIFRTDSNWASLYKKFQLLKFDWASYDRPGPVTFGTV